MRRIWLALLLALCCLLCMACASGETKQLVTADGLTQEAAVNTQQPVVLYSFETKSVEKEYRAEDGTLLYTLPTIHHYCNQSLRHFGFHGITLDECRDLCRLSIAEFYHKLLKLGGCPPDRVAALQPAIRDYDCAAYLSDFTYLTQPYAGVCETLAELNRRGIKNAVLTNKPNAVACALIDRFFGDAMELCVGQTPETISKPDPHSMDPVLEQLGIPREQILYVGDTDVDMQTARNTQTAAAAAAWGYQPLEMLLPYHPEFIVRRPEQLLTIF